MARGFALGGVNGGLIYSASLFSGYPLTIAGWFLISGGPTAIYGLFGIYDEASTNARIEMYYAGYVAGGPLETVDVGNSGSAGSARTTAGVSGATNTWHHACAVFASTTSRSVYLNGGNKNTNTTTVNSDHSAADVTSFAVRRYSGANNAPLYGYLAEWGLWNAELTDAEVAILAKGVSPLLVRPGSLVAYWPLIGRYNPETDIVGNYNVSPNASTPPAIAHPRVLHPIAPWVVSGTAATGTAPNAPSSLTATAVSSSQIDLAWTDNASDETGFELERSHNGTDSWVQIDTPVADSTSASDTGLDTNTTYYYRIRAVNGFGNSDYSNTASDTTIVDQPTSVGISQTVDGTGLILTWTDPVTYFSVISIERSDDGGAFAEITTVNPGVQTYTDSGYSVNVETCYRLRAVDLELYLADSESVVIFDEDLSKLEESA